MITFTQTNCSPASRSSSPLAGYNATLFPVANIASWTNFTSLFLGGNASAPAVVANETRLIGLDGTVNGTQGSNSTLSFLGYLQVRTVHPYPPITLMLRSDKAYLVCDVQSLSQQRR